MPSKTVSASYKSATLALAVVLAIMFAVVIAVGAVVLCRRSTGGGTLR